MARISTRNLLDGGQRVTPPTPTKTTTPAAPFIDPQDVRNPATGLTPAQVAAQQALSEAVTAGAALGIKTTPNVATPGNVPTVTVTSPVRTTATAPVATQPATTAATTPAAATTYTAPDGRMFTDLNAYNAYINQLKADAKRAAGQSAYDLLFQQFNQFGLGALVAPLQGFITEGLSPAEFTLRLRDTDAYKKRFAANQARIQKGLRALSEAEYIGLEDQYQDVMRRYGLPESYYTRGDMGRQEGFERFIGGDVSPVELEDRISNAQERVLQSAPQVKKMLQQFYPDITNGDILAYALDPQNALNLIKRRITAAEIGGAATMAGLATGVNRAEELAQYGVTADQARQGFQAVAGVLPRGSQLAEFYKETPYTQTTAEQEVFGLAGAPEAERQRRRLTQLEQSAFSGQAGVAGGALGRERAGAI
jgi:hypothetical protein